MSSSEISLVRLILLQAYSTVANQNPIAHIANLSLQCLYLPRNSISSSDMDEDPEKGFRPSASHQLTPINSPNLSSRTEQSWGSETLTSS